MKGGDDKDRRTVNVLRGEVRWTDRIACMREEQCLKIIVAQCEGTTKLKRVLNLAMNFRGSHKKRSGFTGLATGSCKEVAVW